MGWGIKKEPNVKNHHLVEGLVNKERTMWIIVSHLGVDCKIKSGKYDESEHIVCGLQNKERTIQ